MLGVGMDRLEFERRDSAAELFGEAFESLMLSLENMFFVALETALDVIEAV